MQWLLIRTQWITDTPVFEYKYKVKLTVTNFCYLTEILHKKTFVLQMTLKKTSFPVTANQSLSITFVECSCVPGLVAEWVRYTRVYMYVRRRERRQATVPSPRVPRTSRCCLDHTQCSWERTLTSEMAGTSVWSCPHNLHQQHTQHQRLIHSSLISSHLNYI